MTQLVTELIPSFDKHLTEMDEGSDDANTVQDIIRYVLSNILASITGSPLESRTIIVADKKALGVEVCFRFKSLLFVRQINLEFLKFICPPNESAGWIYCSGFAYTNGQLNY